MTQRERRTLQGREIEMECVCVSVAFQNLAFICYLAFNCKDDPKFEIFFLCISCVCKTLVQHQIHTLFVFHSHSNCRLLILTNTRTFCPFNALFQMIMIMWITIMMKKRHVNVLKATKSHHIIMKHHIALDVMWIYHIMLVF